jgi:hypothetical protein
MHTLLQALQVLQGKLWGVVVAEEMLGRVWGRREEVEGEGRREGGGGSAGRWRGGWKGISIGRSWHWMSKLRFFAPGIDNCRCAILYSTVYVLFVSGFIAGIGSCRSVFEALSY